VSDELRWLLMAVDVLLIGAHPDDVEWGAGGIAILLRNAGISFAILDLTSGEMGSRGTLEERTAEAVMACVWQVKLAHFGSLIWPTLSY